MCLAVRHLTRLLFALLLASLALTACSDDGNVDEAADRTQDTAADVARDVRNSTENAFAELRTRAEEFIDGVQTRGAPEAKQRVLDQCRDTLEDLRKADSPDADRVDEICNQIRDTDVSNNDAWQQIRNELNQLQPG